MMLSPFAISSDASRQRRSIARARPSGPSSTGQVASSTSAEKTSWSTCLQLLELEVAQQRLADDQLVRVLG